MLRLKSDCGTAVATLRLDVIGGVTTRISQQSFPLCQFEKLKKMFDHLPQIVLSLLRGPWSSSSSRETASR